MSYTLKPVYSSDFVGRKFEVDTLITNLTGRNKKHYIITAPKGTGKTSLLLHLKKELQQPTIFFSFSSVLTQSFSELIKKLSKEIIIAFNPLLKTEINPAELFQASLIDIQNILEPSKLSEDVLEKIKIILSYNKEESIKQEVVINSIFTLAEAFCLHTKKECTLLLDDFEYLKNIKTKKAEVTETFLELSKTFRHTTITIATPNKIKLEDFELITLDNFNIGHTTDLLNGNSENKLESTKIKLIYEFCEGSPFYLNFIGRNLSTNKKEIPELLTDFLDNECTILFQESIAKLSSKELLILACMAEHDVYTPSKISKIINYSQTNIRRFLSIMEEKGFVVNTQRGVFAIIDPVFKKWIKNKVKE